MSDSIHRRQAEAAREIAADAHHHDEAAPAPPGPAEAPVTRFPSGAFKIHVDQAALAAAALHARIAGTAAAPPAPAAPLRRPLVHAAPPAAPGARRDVTLSFFTHDELPMLVHAVKQAGLPKGTPVWVGTYGANAGDAMEIHAAGLKYAPMFTLVRGERYCERREISAADQQKLHGFAAGPKYAGRVPALDELHRYTAEERLDWGRELGERMRDYLRLTKTPADAWQLDEIVPSAAGPDGASLREFMRGVLEGLHAGRPALGDKPVKGIAYVANSALGPLAAEHGPELDRFFKALDDSTFRVVGEEYPRFEGDPRAAARRQFARGEGTLAHEGGARASIARKLVSGLTPGYRDPHASPGVASLGGNIHGMPRAQANAWQQAYMEERVKEGAQGIAEFNWMPGNDKQQVMNDRLAEIAAALKTR